MRRMLVLGGMIICLLVSRPVSAQVGASLSGVVSDSSGAVVPGAKVSITDTATGIIRDVIATDAGAYSATNLQPGPYQVTVSATGFTTKVESGLNLTVGAQAVLNLTLQVGQVSQQVQVTAEAPAVELTSSALSSQVLEGAIRELPLNGRDWTSLATLEPGVSSTASLQVSYTQSTTQRVSRGYGAQVSVAGANPYWNDFRVDGTVTNDYMNVVPGNALGVSLGVDAVEEFSVITNNYSAEYGRTAGGIINAITRSGTNQFHGTAFEFIRNSALDARNFFDPATIPALRRNQFGGSVGGPIRKDKTFFFADYEGLRNVYGSATIATVPSPATNGTQFPGTAHFCSIPTGVTPNCTPSAPVTINSAVLPYLGIWGQVNDGLLGNGDTGNYLFVATQRISANYGLVRVDHHFSSKDSLSGSYVDDTSFYTQPDGVNFIITPQATANKRIVLTETHILGAATVNSFRLAYNRVNVFGAAEPCGPPTYHCAAGFVNPVANNPSLGVVAGFDAPAISPGSGITGDNGGVNDQGYDHETWNSFQGYDDISLVKGRHSISVGVSIEHDQNARDGTLNLSGSFTYSTLQNFLTNGALQSAVIWFLPNETPAGGYEVKNWRVTVLGFYIQDDFRAKKNLTLNLGVRYEPQTAPTEAYGRTASLTNLSDPAVRLGNPVLYNNSLGNVAPRVGLAWDPFGTGKTSIRSAFGMFDINLMPYEFGDSMQLMAPYGTWIRQNNPPAGLFPTAIIPELLTYSGGVGTFAEYMQLHPARSYMAQYNLSIQQQITPSLSLMLAYVGSAGVHLEESDYDVNYAAPLVDTAAGWLYPLPIGSGIKPNSNPKFFSITENNWGGHSSYNGMLGQVTERLNHGFQVQGSFTWGKGFGLNNSAPYPATFRNSLNEWFLFENNRARNDYDIKDNLVINGSWTAPSPHFDSHAANLALGGWVLQSIITARTGVPFSVLMNGDPLGTNTGTPVDFPQYNPGASGCTPGGVNPGNPVNYINMKCFSVPMQNGTTLTSANCQPFSSVPGSCANVVGNAGRNILTAPGLVDVDFSVIKNHQLTERLNAQFRAEFFNIINHPSFNYPSNNTLFSGANGTPIGNAGQITTTSDYSRQIQFALKLVW